MTPTTSAPPADALGALLKSKNVPATADQLNGSRSAALVAIHATIPESGVREGDHVTAHIAIVGSATSLKGGYLVVTPLTGPVANTDILALASGAVSVDETVSPAIGQVQNGAIMEADLPALTIEHDRFELILDHDSANWVNASAIARMINEAEDASDKPLAVVRDQKTIHRDTPTV